MNTEISNQERGRELASKFRATMWPVIDKYEKLGRGGLGRLLNAFAFAISDNEIEALTGRVVDDEAHTVEIAVFTTDHVVYFNGMSDLEHPKVQIIPRSNLTALVILEAPQVIPFDHHNLYGRWAAYELTYTNGLKFQAPLSPGNDKVIEHFNELYPSLLQDLSS
ncbi:hypothetical protein M2368_001421 [Arthrobacter sp. JUb119]|nr:hypothetical protein [Arthrobacter sp. JUb119]